MDNLTVFGTDFTGVTGIKATGTGNGTLTYIRPQGTKSIAQNGTGIDVAQYASVDVSVSGGGLPTLQAKTRTISAAGTFVDTPDSGYDGLSSVTTTVPSASFYVGIDGNGGFFTDGSTRYWRIRGLADLDVSEGDIEGWHGQGKQFSDYAEFRAVPANTTVTPSTTAQTIGGANYMMEGAVTVSAMPTGTAGTPSATKGTVSNHAVSVTPSVTNTTGYITGGTKTGTAVSVSASELVDGTYTINSAGTKDVTNYASASVAAGGATASATKGSVSNHSVTVTPSVTRTAGYVSAGTSSGTAVTVSASELVSGSETKTANGTYDVTNLAELVVNVSGGSSKNVQVAQSTTRSTYTSYTEVISLTCTTAGTYDVYWTTFRSSTSSTWGSQLYLGNTAYGTADTGNWTNHVQNKHLTGVQIAANQTVSVRVRSRGSNYYGYVGTLTIVQTA